MRAVSIKWELDGAPAADNLPDEMEIPDGIAEECIADYLSDQTGWLVKSFVLEKESQFLKVASPVGIILRIPIRG